MSKNEQTTLVGVAGRLLLALVFVFWQTAWAGQNQATKDKPGSPENAARRANQKQSAATTAKAQSEQAQGKESESSVAEEKSSGDGKHEGIKVHGHWTIEVRNPDGSVVTHREFENSLFPSPALASILARHNSVGFWTVALFPSTLCNNTNGAGCSIGEPGQTLLAWNSSNLSVTVSGNSLVLSGTLLAVGGGTITTVQTDSWGCLPTVAPSAPCQTGDNSTNLGFGPGGGFIFTSANPNPGIAVSAGQTVAVTVNISFS